MTQCEADTVSTSFGEGLVRVRIQHSPHFTVRTESSLCGTCLPQFTTQRPKKTQFLVQASQESSRTEMNLSGFQLMVKEAS